jgi:hypothetical protein
VGTFGYFVGLLTLASRYYYYRSSDWFMLETKYWAWQILAVVSGIAALYLGNMLDLTYLRGIGGTFFCLYLLEKYYEIPWRGIGWAWSTLGLAGILYGFVIVIQSYPQYFIFP